MPCGLELVRTAAAASLLGHRHAEAEAALLQTLNEVERRTFQEQLALLIDDDGLAVEVVLAVLGLVVAAVEEQAVLVAAATAGDQLHAQEHLGPGLSTLLVLLQG